MNIILKDIIRNVSLPNHHPESSVIDFSLAYDDGFPPLSQSTPHRVQDTVKQQHSTSSNVLPQTECELNSPSNPKQVQELTAQLALYKEMNTNLQRQIILLQQALRSRTSTSPNFKEQPCVIPSSQTSVSSVSTVPTNNRFQTLLVEKCPEDLPTPSPEMPPAPPVELENTPIATAVSAHEPEDLPPIPLPWLASHTKPSRKPKPEHSKKPSSTKTKPTTSTARKQQPQPQPLNRTVLVLGDLIPKHLVGRRLSRRYKVLNRTLPGTNLELWIKLAPSFIEQECPTAVIIHLGTNNISQKLTSECETLLETLVTVIMNTEPQTQICFSSLTTQRNFGHNVWIREYNARLKDICHRSKCTFINNDNIETCHLVPDGLHLSKAGTSILARNYISTISQLDFHLQANRTVK